MGHWNQKEKSHKETGEDPDGGQGAAAEDGWSAKRGRRAFQESGCGHPWVVSRKVEMRGEKRMVPPGLSTRKAVGDLREMSRSGEGAGAQLVGKPPKKGREAERGREAGASETCSPA